MSAEALDTIADRVRHCTRCELAKSRTQAVPGEGPVDAEIMFVGEGPGAEEDRQGRPFVGAAGRLLNSALEDAGLHRQDVCITNIVKCRPPGNRVPKRSEREACSIYLEQQIEVIRPKIICLLGRTAYETLVGRGSLSGRRGSLIEKGGRIYFPAYHPAAAIYNRSLEEIFRKDVRMLKEELEKLRGKQSP